MPKRRANGEGSIFKRQDGLWAAQYFDKDGKRKYLYGKTQQIVKNKLKEAIRQADMGMTTNSNKITLVQWIYEWLDVYEKPTTRTITYSKYYLDVRNHIEPYFGRLPLKDTRTDILQKFFNEKAKSGRLDGQAGGLSPAVLRKFKLIISGALKKAVELKIVQSNPCVAVKLPKITNQEKRILTIDEQHRLEQEIVKDDNPLSLAILLSLYTGMRNGEVVTLKVDDIDFDKRQLTVKRTSSRYNDPETGKRIYTVNEPKTEKGRRIIPLPNFIIELLKKFIEERSAIIEAIEGNWRGTTTKTAAEWKDPGYLFLTSYGDKSTNENFNLLLFRLLKQAGIKKITFHSLRHTFATRCIEMGFDIKSLSDILGHTDAKMTLNTYTHASSDQKRTNMDKLANFYNAYQ